MHFLLSNECDSHNKTGKQEQSGVLCFIFCSQRLE